MTLSPLKRPLSVALWAVGLACAALAHAAAPTELLAAYDKEAGAAGSPERGKKFFNTNFGRDFGWSCASCHGADPTKVGKDDLTSKRIQPLAPAANPARFTDRSRVDYLFSLNCKDTVGRACTVAEKADVLSWLLTLQP
jgi:mono/diheme cytochrome c family protein